MLKINLAVLAGLVLSVSAFAETGTTYPINNLSWDSFKDSCVHPAEFHAQRAPQAIKIVCKDLVHSWVPAEAGTVALGEDRAVTSEVFSDKYHVNSTVGVVGMAGKTGACPRFKEVALTLGTERSVTCDDILGFKGDLTAYCVSVLDSTKGANAKLENTEETGMTIDTCVQQAKPTAGATTSYR